MEIDTALIAAVNDETQKLLKYESLRAAENALIEEAKAEERDLRSRKIDGEKIAVSKIDAAVNKQLDSKANLSILTEKCNAANNALNAACQRAIDARVQDITAARITPAEDFVANAKREAARHLLLAIRSLSTIGKVGFYPHTDPRVAKTGYHLIDNLRLNLQNENLEISALITPEFTREVLGDEKIVDGRDSETARIATQKIQKLQKLGAAGLAAKALEYARASTGLPVETVVSGLVVVDSE